MKILIILLLLIISGCGITDGIGNDVSPEKSYKVIEIEGHEYIFISRRPFSAEMAITHKANCQYH